MEIPPQRDGHEQVMRFLAARGIRHAVVEHPQTFTAAAEARVAAVPSRHAAKAVMVRDDAGYILAVIPASEMLDLRKLRHAASRPDLRLATEQELADDFPAFEVGSLPPFGALFGCPEFIDVELLAAGRVLCNGGDHRHSIVIDAHELRVASGSGAADLTTVRMGEHADLPTRATRPAAR
jgi:Ala-tRNA(Pro) deacylase